MKVETEKDDMAAKYEMLLYEKCALEKKLRGQQEGCHFCKDAYIRMTTTKVCESGEWIGTANKHCPNCGRYIGIKEVVPCWK